MSLILQIENADRLPDGGPLRVEVTGRGLDIGRDQHLDWTLPDPTRFISGKHCEIRYVDGAYWLHDVSKNGTFINGAEFRPDAPHRLRNGDRLGIGHYIVAVTVADAQGAGPPLVAPARSSMAPADPWGADGAAPPVDKRELIDPRRQRPTGPDFLDWAVAIPTPGGSMPPRPEPLPPRAAMPEEDWLRVPQAPALAPIAAPVQPPTPRRPTADRPADPMLDPGSAPFGPPPGTYQPPSDLPPPSAVFPPAGLAPPANEFVRQLARAAGIPEEVLLGRDQRQLADELGEVLRLVAANLAQLLASRAETKRLMRSSQHTMMSALENNPLKFSVTPEDALRLMFGPPTGHYTDARTTIASSFADLKSHQIKTYSAMQGALEALFEELSPGRIEATTEADRGIGSLVGSRKAKLWDTFVERWRARTARQDGRLNEAFMLLFAEHYDRLQERGPTQR